MMFYHNFIAVLHIFKQKEKRIHVNNTQMYIYNTLAICHITKHILHSPDSLLPCTVQNEILASVHILLLSSFTRENQAQQTVNTVINMLLYLDPFSMKGDSKKTKVH
jgi:hypothetical protein